MKKEKEEKREDYTLNALVGYGVESSPRHAE